MSASNWAVTGGLRSRVNTRIENKRRRRATKPQIDAAENPSVHMLSNPTLDASDWPAPVFFECLCGYSFERNAFALDDLAETLSEHHDAELIGWDFIRNGRGELVGIEMSQPRNSCGATP